MGLQCMRRGSRCGNKEEGRSLGLLFTSLPLLVLFFLSPLYGTKPERRGETAKSIIVGNFDSDYVLAANQAEVPKIMALFCVFCGFPSTNGIGRLLVMQLIYVCHLPHDMGGTRICHPLGEALFVKLGLLLLLLLLLLPPPPSFGLVPERLDGGYPGGVTRQGQEEERGADQDHEEPQV